MDKRPKLPLSLVAATLLSVGGIARAQEIVISEGAHNFVTDRFGNVVRSSIGECVTPGTGAFIKGVPECGWIALRETVVPQAPVSPEAQTAPAPLERITLDTDTTFNFDSSQLTDQGKRLLKEIVNAGESKDVERLRIHITGYADRIGPTDYNLALSEKRANTVRDYLVSAGLPADMITVEGRGEANPVVQCEDMKGITLIECLRPNRRSEVEFAALERVEEQPAAPGEAAPSAPSEQPQSQQPQQPWAPGTDTGTPR